MPRRIESFGMILCLGLISPCLAAPPTADITQYVDKYFAAVAGATSLAQITAFYSTPLKNKKDKDSASPMMAAMEPMILGMLKSQEPPAVRITNATIQGNRAILTLAPKTLPKDIAAQIQKGDSISMSGEMILMKEQGTWKVHKDKWTVQTEGKSGKMKSTFGTDGDAPIKNERPPEVSGADDSMPPMFTDYESMFRKKFMDKWNATGTGDMVYAIGKVLPSGMISELTVKGNSKTSAEATAQIKQLFAGVQPVPVLPADKASTPYFWMSFNWKGESRAVSGPYFENELPTTVLNRH